MTPAIMQAKPSSGPPATACVATTGTLATCRRTRTQAQIDEIVVYAHETQVVNGMLSEPHRT